MKKGTALEMMETVIHHQNCASKDTTIPTRIPTTIRLEMAIANLPDRDRNRHTMILILQMCQIRNPPLTTIRANASIMSSACMDPATCLPGL